MEQENLYEDPFKVKMEARTHELEAVRKAVAEAEERVARIGLAALAEARNHHDAKFTGSQLINIMARRAYVSGEPTAINMLIDMAGGR